MSSTEKKYRIKEDEKIVQSRPDRFWTDIEHRKDSCQQERKSRCQNKEIVSYPVVQLVCLTFELISGHHHDHHMTDEDEPTEDACNDKRPDSPIEAGQEVRFIKSVCGRKQDHRQQRIRNQRIPVPDQSHDILQINQLLAAEESFQQIRHDSQDTSQLKNENDD